jgi:hypothetical protein
MSERIIIDTVPADSQRYKTAGDYFEDADGVVHVLVSDTGNKFFNRLIAMHELAEQIICDKAGIAESDITQFDVLFETHRVEGNIDEPGDHEDAPYRQAHGIAAGIERILCAATKMNWNEYEKSVNRL